MVNLREPFQSLCLADNKTLVVLYLHTYQKCEVGLRSRCPTILRNTRFRSKNSRKTSSSQSLSRCQVRLPAHNAIIHRSRLCMRTCTSVPICHVMFQMFQLFQILEKYVCEQAAQILQRGSRYFCSIRTGGPNSTGVQLLRDRTSYTKYIVHLAHQQAGTSICSVYVWKTHRIL